MTGRVAAYALKLTGIFCSEVIPVPSPEGLLQYSFSENKNISYQCVPDLDNPLARELIAVYESMGDTLALQYGGSAAHNKIFSEKRGQWKAATQSQEFIRTLQRYYKNTYLDGDKQKAINLFLGHFQPQQGKPALWELDSDQHVHVGRHGPFFGGDSQGAPSANAAEYIAENEC